MYRIREKRHEYLIIAVFAAVLLILVCISFMLGRYPVSLSELKRYIFSVFTGDNSGISGTVSSIITNIRFPRIAASILVGAALALSGASYQGVFKNPMVSPDILGASAGAGFGAALGILMSLPAAGIQLMSFFFGLGAVGLSYLISRIVGRRQNITLVLVLSGMVISSLLSAFISLIKYVADPYSKLPEITFWLMGSLSSITIKDLGRVSIPVIFGITVLVLIRWRINVMAFGDEEASALGINTNRLRLAVIICSTLITSSVVSISGQIGWIGLLIPHLCRMLIGPDNKYLIPAALLAGSSYLLIVDNLARNLFSVEIPLGILTSVLGAPFFIYLLLHCKKVGFN